MKSLNYKVVYAIVFATGMFSLVYQIVWQRYLTFLVGADSRSSVITLTVFLTALSLGYWIAGSVSRRLGGNEIRAYGLVEAVIGVWALLFPYMFSKALPIAATPFFNGIVGDTILAAVLTAIPATLMGATLPFLTQGLSLKFVDAGRTHAVIYAVNTLGACAGALLAGFFMIKSLGLESSMYLTGLSNLVLGVLAIALSRNLPHVESRKAGGAEALETEPGKERTTSKLMIYTVAGLSGYLLIGLESYVIRLFAMTTDGSAHAFPTVVCAFILAIGIGAYIAGKLMPRASEVFPWVGIISFSCWFALFLLIPYAPFLDLLMKHWCVNAFGSYELMPLVRFAVLFAGVGVPVIASSMLLPFAFHLTKSRAVALGASTGILYTIATIATVLGGLWGGFYLFEILDNQAVFQSHLFVMFLLALASLFAVKVSNGKRMLLGGSAAILCVLSLTAGTDDFDEHLALSFYYLIPEQGEEPMENRSDAKAWLWEWFGYDKIVAQSTKPEGTVDVFEGVREDGSPRRMITINGRSNSGTEGADYEGNALLSLLPYAITASPERAMVIGIGTGVTVGAIAHQESINHVDACEINAGVIEQFHYFDYVSFGASKNPKVSILKIDALRHLMRTPEKYDVIVSIPSNFWTAGVENLVTPEFYGLIEKSLNPGGTFIQWVPDYEFSEKAFRMVARSFVTTFAGATLWRLTDDDLVLVYQKAGGDNDGFLEQRLQEPTLRTTLAKVSSLTPEGLVAARIGSAEMVAEIAESGVVHSLDKPRLAHEVLRALYNLEPEYAAEDLLHPFY